jgi:hypothetical protein
VSISIVPCRIFNRPTFCHARIRTNKARDITQGILSRSPPTSACVTPINLRMETEWRSNFRSSFSPESRRTRKLRAQLALTVADDTSLCDCKSLNRYVFRSPSTDQERETPQYPRIHFDEYGGCPRSGAIGSYGPINAPV